MYMLWNCWIITKRVNGWSMAGKQQAKYQDTARLCTWDVNTLQYLQARLTEAAIRRKIGWMSCGWMSSNFDASQTMYTVPKDCLDP